MGYPVILIHGMWCTPRNWQRVVELLAPRGYDCHVPALPAHEPVPDQPLQVGARSVREYLAFLEDWVRRLGLDRPPILIGHSMGGLLAQALACRIGTLAVVLLTPAAPAGIPAIRASNLRLAMPHFLRWDFWRKAYKPGIEAARRDLFNGLPAEQQQRLYEGLVHESGRAICELALSFLDLRGSARVDAHSLKVPVYVVSAGEDRVTPPAVVRAVAARYAQVATRHYPRRGHWVLDDEETEEMVHAICGWLRPIELRRDAERVARPLVVSEKARTVSR